jgi:hypothetical protein
MLGVSFLTDLVIATQALGICALTRNLILAGLQTLQYCHRIHFQPPWALTPSLPNLSAHTPRVVV